jgi:hypothetical protein
MVNKSFNFSDLITKEIIQTIRDPTGIYQAKKKYE